MHPPKQKATAVETMRGQTMKRKKASASENNMMELAGRRPA